MNITRSQLKQIIKEELEAVYEEKSRCKDGETLQPSGKGGELKCMKRWPWLKMAMKMYLQHAGQ